jgi:Na+-transporting NADH:ubiquinone oxidoreductase subunit A
MSKTVKLRKGLDIRLLGEAEKVVVTAPAPSTVSIKPSDFHGMTPKMVAKEGDHIKAGGVIFYNKYNEPVKVVSPVSGTIQSVIRGEKRKIMEIIIAVDASQEFVENTVQDVSAMSGDEVKAAMLAAGLWPFIKQRPLDIVAVQTNAPKAIFVSAFDSAPLAPDFNFSMHGQDAEFQAGLNALSKLTTGKVHLTVNANTANDAKFEHAKGVQINKIAGKHPAGNVGTQIHHIDPVNKGEFVWTVNAQDVAIIGRYFITGRFDATKIIAVTGSEAKAPTYVKTILGANVESILADGVKTDAKVRVVSGNALTGDKIDANGHLGFYANQLTLLPEGDEYKFFLTTGWLGLGFDKFSNSRLFPTFLTPSKRFRLDTNTNGEERAFVVTGELEKVFPFDILPMQLVKAAITDDIDGMENLGIYEVAPEDFALCEYVCTTKINIQDKIRQGLDLIGEECM